MNDQPKSSKEEKDLFTIQIIANLNEAPIEIRKKPADEPIYFTHL